MLILSRSKTIRNYFIKLGSAAGSQECLTVIRNVSENLQVTQKHVKILTDKIHNKPSVQYQGGYLIGFSVDELEKLAKTGLAVMLALLIGQPIFVERLMPIFSLKADFSF